MHAELGIPVTAAATAQQAVKDAEIICTVTSATEPILHSEWVQPGTHINAVGSSHAGPAEIDNALVARARFFADSREGVLQQGENLRAKKWASSTTATSSPKSDRYSQAPPKAAALPTRSPSTSRWATLCRTSPAPGGSTHNPKVSSVASPRREGCHRLHQRRSRIDGVMRQPRQNR